MSNIIKREFNGIAIAFEGKEKVSLTDLWKSAGSPNNFQPAQWLRWPQTQEFVNSLAQSLNVLPTHNDILQTKRGGKSPGTWAHWQIALAYAKHLSPELHMFVNQCFMERLQEERNPELAFSRGRERAIRQWKARGKSEEWIAERQKLIISTKEDNSILAKHGDDGRVYGMCHNALYKPILGGTAEEVRAQRGLAKKDSIRDNVSVIDLVKLQLASLVSKERIVEMNIRGNQQCANVHETMAQRIQHATTTRGV